MAGADAVGEELISRLGTFLRDIGVDDLADFRFGYNTEVGKAELQRLLDKEPDLQSVVPAVMGLWAEAQELTSAEVTAGLIKPRPVAPRKRALTRNLMGRMVPGMETVDAVRPTKAIRVPPEVHPKMCQAARVELDARRALAVPTGRTVLGVPSAARTGAPTIAAADQRRRVKAVADVWALLRRVGMACPRGRSVLAEDGSAKPGLEMAFTDAACGTLQPERIRVLAREAGRFLDWVQCLEDGVTIKEADTEVLVLCAYLRVLRHRGKTVPSLGRQAVCWMQDTLGLEFGAKARETYRAVDAAEASKASAVLPAAMLPIDMVINLEQLAMDSPSDVVRVLAGMVAACACGVKRWADVQHVSSIEAADDCVIITSWRSKGKKLPYTW